MILGRSPNLVLGFLVALFNTAVAFHVAGFAPTGEQIAVVNVLLGALVAVIANVPELAIHAGIKAITRLNDAATGASSPGTDYANKVINGDGYKVVTNPTPADDAGAVDASGISGV